MAELAALVASIGTAITEGVGATAAAATAAEGAAAAGTAATAAAPAAGGSTLGLVGTGLTTLGTIAGGLSASQQAKFQADQLKKQAAEEKAIASRKNEEQRQKTATVLSRQKAVAAASGAGVTNPTILDVMADTAQRGEYLAQMETYGGESRARGRLDQASATKASGDAALTGSILEGVGTAASGFRKYRYG